MSAETITLARQDDGWIAIDGQTGITARGGTREQALESLDEAVARTADDGSGDEIAIVKTADVLHGKPRISGTRLGVFTIGESIREGGQTVEEILDAYPDLTVEQVEAALAYYDAHPGEMDTLRDEEDGLVGRLREQSRAPDA